MNNDWQFEPSFLIRKMQFQKGITDLTTRILYLENNWIASLDNGDILNTTPVFKSFIGVEIPPDATQVNIHYRPTKRIVLVFLKVIVILASIIVLVFWKPRKISM